MSEVLSPPALQLIERLTGHGIAFAPMLNLSVKCMLKAGSVWPCYMGNVL